MATRQAPAETFDNLLLVTLLHEQGQALSVLKLYLIYSIATSSITEGKTWFAIFMRFKVNKVCLL